jgi:hypothetical protein
LDTVTPPSALSFARLPPPFLLLPLIGEGVVVAIVVVAVMVKVWRSFNLACRRWYTTTTTTTLCYGMLRMSPHLPTKLLSRFFFSRGLTLVKAVSTLNIQK